MSDNKFNIRVYGLLINNNNQILLSDEEINGVRFIKFPGGGLEFGEGLKDALKREFIEECDLAIEVTEHFYTTDFFVESVFGGGQLISVYYLVKPIGEMLFKISNCQYDFDGQDGISKQCFRFVAIDELSDNSLTFPVDKHVVKLLNNKFL
ncbi:NUDIX domain-containing protein [Pedobacter alpinus]|uniref:NUDIX domain-containing protein n=1 Tax=Pedobacter alpinus TaxID=1590643 RepID=A0ABW5TUS3_9SPHI